MINEKSDVGKPSIHLLASESDMVADMTPRIEHDRPVVAAMLLGELERADLHDLNTLPPDAVRIGSTIDYVDEKSRNVRSVTLVLPRDANIAEGRISILTPMGAALYGLLAGSSIKWPTLDGEERQISILSVSPPASAE